MKKSTKGLVAAGAAATILLGGAGTLAYWTADADVAGGSLNSGSIDLGAVSCTGWKHTGTDTAVVKIVPGDNVYNDCTTTLTLVGDNIGATLDIDDAAFTTTDPASALAAELDVDVELRSGGAVIAAVDTEGTTSVTARITVDFPYGTVSADPLTADSNVSQNGNAALDSLQLVAVQTNEKTTPVV